MACAAFADSISSVSANRFTGRADGCSSRRAYAQITSWGASVLWATVLLLAIVGPLPARAQSGGPYVVTSSVIAGGGSTTPPGAGTTVSGTIGQPLANPSGPATGGEFAVSAGFWPAQEAAVPTPSVTMTVLATATATATLTNTPGPSATPTTATATLSPTMAPGTTTTPTHTRTVGPTTTTTQPPTATATAVTRTPTPTAGSPTPSATPSPSPTGSAPATATVTATPPACAGDCSGDGTVTVDELVMLVDIVLENGALTDCPVGDADHDRAIAINDILVAVNNALRGCP